jgi:hypothetical protein
MKIADFDGPLSPILIAPIQITLSSGRYLYKEALVKVLKNFTVSFANKSQPTVLKNANLTACPGEE